MKIYISLLLNCGVVAFEIAGIGWILNTTIMARIQKHFSHSLDPARSKTVYQHLSSWRSCRAKS